MNITKILAALLLVLAVGLGIGAFMLSRQPARTAESPVASISPKADTQAEMHAVVVASKAVPAGQRITADDVKVAQLPAAVAHSFTNLDKVLGRTTVVALPADAPVFEQHLITGLALQIEPGQRAVSIAIKEPMAAGHHIRPGDFVDVFFTLDTKSEHATIDTQTRLLLARSRVLAYGTASVEAPPPTAAQRQEQQEQDSSSRRTGQNREGNRPENANTTVLAVAVEDVDRLTLAEKYGQLTLALRHPNDTSVPDASLFAALPSSLQPVAGRLKKGDVLPAADRSYAGLRFKDLATGAETKNTRRPPQPISSAIAQASPSKPVATPVRTNTVDVYQGATLQTVNY